MPFKNDGIQVQQYVYDFAVDGGAVSTIDLSAKANYSPLPVGAIVVAVTAWVQAACTSGGSATLEWGNSADPDGYSGTAKAVAALTLNAVFNQAEGAGALLWDNTNDADKRLYIDTNANGQFKVAIGTAALTAGKVVFAVEYLMLG